MINFLNPFLFSIKLTSSLVVSESNYTDLQYQCKLELKEELKGYRPIHLEANSY